MNEEACIITSLNLYEFSQVNNNEMGVLIQRSEEVRISLERVPAGTDEGEVASGNGSDAETGGDKLTSSRIAAKLGMKTGQFLERAVAAGYLAADSDKHLLTPKGEKAGVEFVAKSRFGPYFLWPQDFHPV